MKNSHLTDYQVINKNHTKNIFMQTFALIDFFP